MTRRSQRASGGSVTTASRSLRVVRTRLGISAALVAGALALASCGSDEPTSSSAPATTPTAAAPSAAHEEPGHVHGLGTQGADLLIATHAGLWRAKAGQTETKRVGQARHDLMGFTTQSATRFLASGHPDPSDPDLPANLGLIVSRDGGRTWTSVSLLGKADFHVLEASASSVYGAEGRELRTSDAGGRSWHSHTAPGGLFSLAIGPADPERFVASSEVGLVASSDAGATMRAVSGSESRAGLLAWPSETQLYLVDADGVVSVSGDGGASWSQAGEIGGPPAAFIAADGRLYAALADGTVKVSTDGGRSWMLRAKA